MLGDTVTHLDHHATRGVVEEIGRGPDRSGYARVRPTAAHALWPVGGWCWAANLRAL